MPLDIAPWLVWQLADSAFPSGGFAHSGGLEAAYQHGEVRSRAELSTFIETALEQASLGMLPLMLATWHEPDRASEFDDLCDAFTTNHVANRASRLQGKALMAAMSRVFFTTNSQSASAPLRVLPALPCSHLSTVFGLCLRRLEIAPKAASRLFIFHHLRGLVAAAVRLGIIGPMDAQGLQHSLADRAEVLSHTNEMQSMWDLTQVTPLIDLWQGTQDRLYSRLFQS